MTTLYAFVTAVIFGCGIYMILSRNIVRLLLGLSLLTTAANLIVFQATRFVSAQPPLVAGGESQLGVSADPVPQALVLTAIVIGFALTVILAGLALRLHRAHGTLSTIGIQSAERLGHPSVPVE